MTPGIYEILDALVVRGNRLPTPFEYRDRLSYKAHVEPGTVRQLIDKAPTVRVELGDLYAIQHTVDADRVLQYMRDPGLSDGKKNAKTGTAIDVPIVVQFNGRRYAHDGHHRLTAEYLTGSETALVRLIDLDAAAAKKSSMKVQTLVFSKKKFSRAKAIAWAKTHDFKSSDVDETETSFRLRQRDPGRFKPGSFRTVKLAPGISAVIGKLK